MTHIKLCGLSRLSDIELVNQLKPEFIGFVFAPKSRRYVAPPQASILKKALTSEVKAVGVFVNESIENIIKLLEAEIIDLVQLHGSETNEYITTLRKYTDKPIIKAFRINNLTDIEQVKNCVSDYILLDSGVGGTGKTFNWNLLDSLHQAYFLAGGLSIDNIELAIKTLDPYAVDVSSGIETNGVKDPNKMTKFVQIVRKAVKS